jgi:GNAT superfamily N-acetyltransferase
MALENGKPVAAAAVSYAISLALGKVVAKLEHLIVTESRRHHGIGTAFIEALAGHLRLIEIARLDVDVHLENKIGRQFYLDLDFEPSHEERMALLL